MSDFYTKAVSWYTPVRPRQHPKGMPPQTYWSQKSPYYWAHPKLSYTNIYHLSIYIGSEKSWKSGQNKQKWTQFDHFCTVLTLLQSLLKDLGWPRKVSQVLIGQKIIQSWYFEGSAYTDLLKPSWKGRRKTNIKAKIGKSAKIKVPLLLIGVEKWKIWWLFSFIIWVWPTTFISDIFQNFHF